MIPLRSSINSTNCSSMIPLRSSINSTNCSSMIPLRSYPSSRIVTISICPFLQALRRGVAPQSSFMSMFALNLTSSFTASVQPFSAAQWRREALVAGSTSLGSPPFSRRDLKSCQICRSEWTTVHRKIFV